MDDTALTRQAIAELIRDLPCQNKNVLSKPLERKINPLGKPNKRFLGRTLNSVVKYNERKNEFNQSCCQKKLQEINEKYERRKQNAFYCYLGGSSSVERSSRHKRNLKNKFKNECRSRTKSPSRCRSKWSQTQKTTPRKESKRKSTSLISYSRSEVQFTIPGEERSSIVPTTAYYMYSNTMAITVATAFDLALFAPRFVNNNSPSSTISFNGKRQLLSDDERIQKYFRLNALPNDIGMQDNQAEGSFKSVSENCYYAYSKESYNNGLKLSSNSISDIEIVDETQKKSDKRNSKPNFSIPSHFNVEITVDLTDD